MNTKTKSGALIKTLTGLAAAALLFAACEYDAPHPFLINGEYELKTPGIPVSIDLTLEKNGDTTGLYDLTLEAEGVSFKGTLKTGTDYSGSYNQTLSEIDVGSGWITYEKYNSNELDSVTKARINAFVSGMSSFGIKFGTETTGDYTYYNSYKTSNSANSAYDIDVKRALTLTPAGGTTLVFKKKK